MPLYVASLALPPVPRFKNPLCFVAGERNILVNHRNNGCNQQTRRPGRSHIRAYPPAQLLRPPLPLRLLRLLLLLQWLRHCRRRRRPWWCCYRHRRRQVLHCGNGNCAAGIQRARSRTLSLFPHSSSSSSGGLLERMAWWKGGGGCIKRAVPGEVGGRIG